MSVPQIKDRPASALRAMFAGIGSLLSPKGKRKSTPAAEAPADAVATAPKPVTQEVPAAETPTAEPQAEAPVAEAPAAEAPVAEAEVKAEAEAVEDATPVPAEAAAPAETAEAIALPLANYDELTVASLRARLRNLTNDDLTLLLGYEREHQNRPEVVKMFQNRLVKMTTGLPKLQA